MPADSSLDDDVGATSSGNAFHSAPGRVSARRAGADPAKLAGATSAAETNVAKTGRRSRIFHPLPSLTVGRFFLGAQKGTWEA